MDAQTETPRLNTNTELKYFEQPAIQTFFTKWCEINDSITPQFIDRAEWLKQDFLRPDAKGGKTLFLPKDLQLWEMVDVIEKVDKDTYTSSPDLATSKREKLRTLGEMFKDTGVYIAQRIGGINRGKGIAENLAQDFYNYGYALSAGEKPKPTTLDEITQIGLTSDQIDRVDKWLAGDKLYFSRKAKAEQLISGSPKRRDETIEKERQKTLAQFFDLAQKALDAKITEREPRVVKEKPWEQVTPVKKAFLDKIESQIQKAIETPKQELIDVVLRRGLENLVKEMRANILPEDDRNRFKELFSLIGVDFIAQQEKLYDVLNIPALKAELGEVRSTGDLRKIGEKEIEIASKIQDLIRHLPFQSTSNNPAEMVAKGYTNCVGASALGGGFLSELGINYLVGSVPDHSILVLATSDRKVIWMDMLNYVSNEPLTDEMIQKTTNGGKPLKIDDVWEFSNHPTAGGLTLDMDLETFKLQLPGVKEWHSPYLTLLPPRTGHLVQLLNNTASLFHIADMKEEALEADRLAIAVDPQIADLYKNFSLTLSSLGRYDEAIDAARKAIALDPRHYDSYQNLGKALVKSGRREEAIGVYNKALEIDPRAVDTYEELGSAFIDLKRFNEALNLYHELILIEPKNVLANLRLGSIYWTFGQNKEAVEYCQKAINAADKDNEKDKGLVEIAEQIIYSINNPQ